WAASAASPHQADARAVTNCYSIYCAMVVYLHRTFCMYYSAACRLGKNLARGAANNHHLEHPVSDFSHACTGFFLSRRANRIVADWSFFAEAGRAGIRVCHHHPLV